MSAAVRVKICGVTRRRDAERACELGASHVGFVLVPGSPRCVAAAAVASLARDLPATAEPVLVLRCASRDTVLAAVEASGVRTVQLFDFEEPTARALERRGLRVHRVGAADPSSAPPFHAPLAFRPRPGPSRPWHVDVAGGGSGRRFDWRLLGPRAPAHVFVAGGITPDNVAELLAHAPWGIDLSSGVESSPGIKDTRLLARLFERVQEVER